MILDSRELKCFLAVSKNGNFTRAAEQLFLTQPAVSEQVAKLEKELGTKLFDRQYHQLVLTPAGKVFQKYASQVMQETVDLAEQLSQLNTEGTNRPLKVALYLNQTFASLDNKFNDFSKIAHTQVMIDRSQGLRSLAGLRSHQFDFVLAREKAVPGLKWLDISQDEFVVFVDHHDELANQKHLQLKDLQSYIWIQADIDGMDDYVDIKKGLAKGIHQSPMEVHSLSAVLKNLHHLKSFAILPKSSFDKKDGVVPVSLSGVKVATKFKIGLAYLQNQHSDSVDRFVRVFNLI